MLLQYAAATQATYSNVYTVCLCVHAYRAFELTDVINGLEGMMMEMADEELTGMTVNFRYAIQSPVSGFLGRS